MAASASRAVYQLEERARWAWLGKRRDRHIAGYGGWSFGALNLRAGGPYAFHTVDADRTVSFSRLLRSCDSAL